MSIKNRRIIFIIFALLSLGALIAYSIYASPGSQRKRSLLDQQVAEQTFSEVVASFGKDIEAETIKSVLPYWEYVTYEKTGKPITRFDYGKQWVVRQGQISSSLSEVPIDKQSILAYDTILGKIGLSQVPIDHAGQKAGIQKILDEESDPNGYWHKYYQEIEHYRLHPTESFSEILDDRLKSQSTADKPLALTYYAQLYELKITFTSTNHDPSRGSVILNLKYGCKIEFDCYGVN